MMHGGMEGGEGDGLRKGRKGGRCMGCEGKGGMERIGREEVCGGKEGEVCGGKEGEVCMEGREGA